MRKLIVIFTMLIAFPSFAADYYVSTTGSGSNPGTLAEPWDLDKANTTLTAGDTAYLRAGNYSTYISPTNSGTSGNVITYQNYQSEVVTIYDTAYAIYLNGDDYIKITGINATLFNKGIYIKDGNYNEISYGTFGPQDPLNGWEISVIDTDSQHNHLHHLTMYEAGGNSGTPPNGTDSGSVLDIGIENGQDSSAYNIIENCTFYRGGHHVVGIHTGYNIFRNNYLYNDMWSASSGNRSLYLNNLTSASQPYAGHNLIEGNRFGYAAKPVDAITVGVVAMSTNDNIFRYNTIFHGNAYGLGTSAYGNQNSQGSDNMIYHNTIFNMGLGGILNDDPEGDTYISEHAGIYFASGSNENNMLRNNLFEDTGAQGDYAGNTSEQDFAGDYDGNTQSDPSFTNPTTTPYDPTDTVNPNLHLESDSPVIDAGAALTYANGSGSSSTTLVVDDASFFQDWSPEGGDVIYIRTVARPNVLVDFESGSDGNSIDASYLNSVTHDNSEGTWSIRSGSSRLDVDTGQIKQTDYPTQVNGTWYDDSSGTRAGVFDDNSTSQNLFQYYWGSGDSEVSSGTFIRLHTVPSGYYGDVMMIVSGSTGGEDSYCVAQTRDSGSGDFIQAHTWSSGPGTHYGDPIYYTDDTWYWLALNWDGGTGVCTVSLYDPSDWSLEGMSTLNYISGHTAEKIMAGNDPHSESISDDHSYDNMMIDFSGKWPLLPTGAIQTATISSISGNTITLTSAKSWNDGDEIGLYQLTDGTVVYQGNSPDPGSLEYTAGADSTPTIPNCTGFSGRGFIFQ